MLHFLPQALWFPVGLVGALCPLLAAVLTRPPRLMRSLLLIALFGFAATIMLLGGGLVVCPANGCTGNVLLAGVVATGTIVGLLICGLRMFLIARRARLGDLASDVIPPPDPAPHRDHDTE